MNKIKIKRVLSSVCRCLVVALLVPNFYWYIGFKHDVKLLKDFERTWTNDTGEESLCNYIMPLSIFELEAKLFQCPVMIVNDKMTQMFLFETVEIPDVMTVDDYAVSLEDDLQERWHFWRHINELDFWVVRYNDKLQELCQLLLDKSFLEHEDWESLQISLQNDDGMLADGSTTAVYGILAEFIGYDIDLTGLESEISDSCYHWIYSSYVWFIAICYIPIYFITLIIMKVSKIWKRRRDDKRSTKK